MSLRLAKKIFNHTTVYKCTMDMLYLNDSKVVLTSIGDADGYNGKISSCINITAELCERYPPIKVAKRLHDQYGMTMTHIHRCIAIYLGGIGQMDDEYIKKYPESGLSNLGTMLMVYNSAVEDTMALAEVVQGTKKLPHYNLDSFSIVYHFDDSNQLDLDKTFDAIDSYVDIALRYESFCGIFASYNGNTETIRRKISTTIGKNIPKRYVDFLPKTMDKDGMIMARWNERDLKVYRDKFIFDCQGDDLENVDKYVNDIASIIRVDKKDMIFAYQSNTKASMLIEIDNWNALVLEDLIANNKNFAKILRVANGVLGLDEVGEDILHKNRSLVVYVSYPPTRCVFRYNGGSLKVSIASRSIDDMGIIISAAIVWKLLEKYRKEFNATYEKYSIGVKKIIKKSPGRKSRIDELRNRLPELFANNYTRECHILPIMVDTKEEAEEYRKMGRLVIKYPLDGPYSRWYTSSSDELYVGLKINRLSNKEMFKYIVTCYTSNHYEIPSRETYVYYRGESGVKGRASTTLRTLRILPIGRKGPLPIAMTMEYNLQGYSRIGTGGSFVNCVAYALGVDPERFPRLVRKGLQHGLLNVVRQEVWNKSDEEILKDVCDISTLDAKYYRLLEEVYKCNILLIEVGHHGKYSISIPQCKGQYLWDPRDGKYIIVMKNEKKLYEDCLVAYELVVNDRNKGIFGEKDPLVAAIISFKMTHTVRNDIGNVDVEEQYVTEYGKCNLVATKNGLRKCNSRPLYCPTIDIDVVRKCARTFVHMTTESGVKWLSSTYKYLYFPDDVSFHDWVSQ